MITENTKIKKNTKKKKNKITVIDYIHSEVDRIASGKALHSGSFPKADHVW